MQKKPEKLTIDRMRDLLSSIDIDSNPRMLLGDDLSIIINVQSVIRMVLGSESLFQIPDFRCGFVRSGSARVRLNLVEREIHTGMILFVTPGSIVQPIYASDDFNLTGMALSPEMLQLSLGGHFPAMFNGNMTDGRLVISQELLNIIQNMFSLLIDVVKKQKEARQVICSLVAAIINQYDTLFTDSEYSLGKQYTNERRIFDRFIYLVNNNCKEHHQLSFYADKMAISGRYLGTAVRVASGSTAKEWIDSALITQAKLMLRHSDLQVSSISDRLYFPNYSFFNKYFKRLTGMTPLEYRRKC